MMDIVSRLLQLQLIGLFFFTIALLNIKERWIICRIFSTVMAWYSLGVFHAIVGHWIAEYNVHTDVIDEFF